MGVIIHLESDILECGVKWASERNTRSKASSGEGISAGLFKILKDATASVALNVSKFRKLCGGHRTGKVYFSFQSQRKAMLKTFKL